MISDHLKEFHNTINRRPGMVVAAIMFTVLSGWAITTPGAVDSDYRVKRLRQSASTSTADNTGTPTQVTVVSDAVPQVTIEEVPEIESVQTVTGTLMVATADADPSGVVTKTYYIAADSGHNVPVSLQNNDELAPGTYVTVTGLVHRGVIFGTAQTVTN